MVSRYEHLHYILKIQPHRKRINVCTEGLCHINDNELLYSMPQPYIILHVFGQWQQLFLFYNNTQPNFLFHLLSLVKNSYGLDKKQNRLIYKFLVILIIYSTDNSLVHRNKSLGKGGIRSSLKEKLHVPTMVFAVRFK